MTPMAYRALGAENLYPADAALNLPEEKHSHGLRKLAAIEAARSSFDKADGAIRHAAGRQGAAGMLNWACCAVRIRRAFRRDGERTGWWR